MSPVRRAADGLRDPFRAGDVLSRGFGHRPEEHGEASHGEQPAQCRRPDQTHGQPGVTPNGARCGLAESEAVAAEMDRLDQVVPRCRTPGRRPGLRVWCGWRRRWRAGRRSWSAEGLGREPAALTVSDG
jgi:hypothetical protein